MESYMIGELVDQGEYAQALREVDKAFRLGRAEADLYVCRGRAHIGLNSYHEGVRDLDEAIRLGVEEPVAYDERGRAHLELGHYQCAESDFDRAITLGLEEARYWWGEFGEDHLYECNGPLRFSMAEVYFFRGRVHLQLSNHEQAIEDFGKSIRLDPEQEGPYAGRGHIPG